MAGMDDVFAAIARERGYQHRKWGPKEHGIAAWLLIARGELGEAERAWLKDGDKADANALGEMLQVAAVLVAGLEQHGVVERPACVADRVNPDPTIVIGLPPDATPDEQASIRVGAMEMVRQLRDPACRVPLNKPDSLNAHDLKVRLSTAIRERDAARAQVEAQRASLAGIDGLRRVLTRIWGIDNAATDATLIAANLLRVLHARREQLISAVNGLESFHRSILSDEWSGNAFDAEAQKSQHVMTILQRARAMALRVPDRGDPVRSLGEPLTRDLVDEPGRTVDNGTRQVSANQRGAD